jgi:hypothetical protein
MTSHRPTGRDRAGYEYHRSGPVTLYLGDAADVLAAMPDGSVDAVVTSPPFWSLRDYGTGAWVDGDAGCGHRLPARRRVDGAMCPRCGAMWSDPQYGLEATIEQYMARLVGVFDQVRRVLSPTGTCWLNLGDSYSGGAKTRPRHRRVAVAGEEPHRSAVAGRIRPPSLRLVASQRGDLGQVEPSLPVLCVLRRRASSLRPLWSEMRPTFRRRRPEDCRTPSPGVRGVPSTEMWAARLALTAHVG